MNTLQFRNGDIIPTVGLGTWKAIGDEVKQAVKDAIEVGYRHIDTAAVYGNETEIGEALNELIQAGKISREELFITSKLWNDAHEPSRVKEAARESLDKLQLDYLDLYLIHWPVAFKWGVAFPKKPEDYIEPSQLPSSETWKAMVEVKNTGMAKHIGVSNFSIKKLADLMEATSMVPEMNQVELHPLLQQNELKEFCDSNQILLTAYSPLGSGDRSQEMKAANEPNLFQNETVQKIAKDHGVHPAKVLVAWHANRASVVIPKSTDKAHMRSNLEAGDLTLSSEEMKQIEILDQNYRYITGKFFEMPGSGYSNIYDE